MASNNEKTPGEILLSNVRIAFPVLWTPKRVGADAKGEPRYSCAGLLTPDHPGREQLKALIQKVAKEKWKDKAATVLKQLVAADKVCLHDGDTKAEYDGFPGNFFISTSSKVRPLVIDRDRTPLSEEDGKPYSGCYVNLKLDVWAQDNKWGKRINAQLQGVQFVRDGEPFAGGGRPADVDEFAELEAVDESDEFGAAEESGEDDGFGDLL